MHLAVVLAAALSAPPAQALVAACDAGTAYLVARWYTPGAAEASPRFEPILRGGDRRVRRALDGPAPRARAVPRGERRRLAGDDAAARAGAARDVGAHRELAGDDDARRSGYWLVRVSADGRVRVEKLVVAVRAPC
jgi:hypothetical protein